MIKQINDAIESLRNKQIIKLDEYLDINFKNKDVVIYGAGAFGKEICTVLKAHNIYPKSFLDINKIGTLEGIEINHPDAYRYKNSVVIFSIVLNKSKRIKIEEYIKEIGFSKIIDGQIIRAMYIELQGEHTYNYFKTKQNEITKPLLYLEDNESKNLYVKNIVSHITRDYTNCFESDEAVQYFIKSVPFKKGFTKFVDCGAYNGDTFLEWESCANINDTYIGFEPILESYALLSKTISEKTIQATVVPAAVSDETKFIKFTNMLGSSSTDVNGNITALCVKLDDILKNQNPSMVKMDIEGEEIKALKGAKNLIFDAKPELAISVYHYINHFWEIPNLIYEWDLDYKFYFKTHSSACMETILYAVRKV